MKLNLLAISPKIDGIGYILNISGIRIRLDMEINNLGSAALPNIFGNPQRISGQYKSGAYVV